MLSMSGLEPPDALVANQSGDLSRVHRRLVVESLLPMSSVTRSKPVRQATGLALLLGVGLPLVELARIALTDDGRVVAVAFACTTVFLSLHVWHLLFGLRGMKPPRGLWTLALMALAQAIGVVVVGPSWTLMLASFASSALIVLDVKWAAWVVSAVLVFAFVFVETSAAGDGRTGVYFVTSLAFRSVTLFVTVWFAAAVHQLESARSSIAALAAAGERWRVRDEMQDLAQEAGAAVAERARRVQSLLGSGDLAAAAEVLGELAELAREALARVRDFARTLRISPASFATSGRTLTRSGPDSPVERVLADAGRSQRVLILAHAPASLFFLAIATTGLGQPAVATVPVLVGLTAGVALVAAQLFVSLAVSAQCRLPHSLGVLAGVWTLGLVPAVLFGSGWGPAAWFVSAAGALILPRGPTRVVGFLAPVAMWSGNEVRLAAEAFDLHFWQLLWIASYTATVAVVGAAGMVCAARLTPVVVGLIAARRAQAAQVEEEERWRISRDLHDLLGQTLSALSLKAELARRRLAADPDAARREVEDVAGLGVSLAEQLRTVSDEARIPRLANELRTGSTLLRLNGTHVNVRLDTPPAELDALLGWAVREGITNVLRHSRAKHCSITIGNAGDTVLMAIVNDGCPISGDHSSGQGLTNLKERFEAAGGTMEASSEDERFRLHAVVPAPCPSQALQELT
jgi:signal transduction histidine kinase